MKAIIVNTSSIDNAITFVKMQQEKSYNRTLYFLKDEKPSECLINKLEQLLKEENEKLDDIDVFACVIGPGSFTGTRIGLSTIYGLCYGLDKPFIKINLFETIKDDLVVAAHAGGAYLKQGNNKCFIDKTSLEKLKINSKNKIKCLDLDYEKNYFENCFETIDYVKSVLDYVKMQFDNKEFDSIFSSEPFYIEKSQAEVSLDASLKTFTIRKANLDDVEAILRLENVCFENNVYSKETIINEIKKSFSTFLVGLINEEIVCFGIFAKPNEEGEIIQICVIDKFRGMGFAKKLFDEFVKIENPKKIFLEVNKNNVSAISLYKKLGFTQIATRKNYYENGDDCLVFSKIF